MLNGQCCVKAILGGTGYRIPAIVFDVEDLRSTAVAQRQANGGLIPLRQNQRLTLRRLGDRWR